MRTKTNFDLHFYLYFIHKINFYFYFVLKLNGFPVKSPKWLITEEELLEELNLTLIFILISKRQNKIKFDLCSVPKTKTSKINYGFENIFYSHRTQVSQPHKIHKNPNNNKPQARNK